MVAPFPACDDDGAKVSAEPRRRLPHRSQRVEGAGRAQSLVPPVPPEDSQLQRNDSTTRERFCYTAFESAGLAHSNWD